MMKALANDKVVQNVNHTLVFHFYLFTKDFFKLFFSFYKINQNTDKEEDLREIILRINMKQNLNRTPNLSN